MIKAGLMLEIDSWENDGDYNRTKQISGLTDEEVLFLIDLLSLFEGKFGNAGLVSGNPSHHSENSIEEFIKSVKSIVEKHGSNQFSLFFGAELDKIESMSDEDYVGLINEVVCDKLLGQTQEYNDIPYFFRQCDSIRLYFVPSDLIKVDVKKYIDYHNRTV